MGCANLIPLVMADQGVSLEIPTPGLEIPMPRPEITMLGSARLSSGLSGLTSTDGVDWHV